MTIGMESIKTKNASTNYQAGDAQNVVTLSEHVGGADEDLTGIVGSAGHELRKPYFSLRLQKSPCKTC